MDIANFIAISGKELATEVIEGMASPSMKNERVGFTVKSRIPLRGHPMPASPPSWWLIFKGIIDFYSIISEQF